MAPIFASVANASQALSLSRREIYRLIDRGEIEAIRVGRRRLIVVESLHAYADRRRREAVARREAAAA